MSSTHIMYIIAGCSLLVSSLTMGAVAADDAKEKLSVPPLKSRLCAGCHGADGISISPNIPNLAGQKKNYIVAEINDYRSGRREDPMMSKVAKGLTDRDVEELATYFSNLD
jgi:cytochrome c553